MVHMRQSFAALTVALAFLPSVARAVTYDHVVVVMLENHSYQEILSDPGATYINNTLRPQSADITGSYGLQHPSQPNYHWLFSGSNQGITTDTPPTSQIFSTPNLASGLIASGRTFGGYADAYPGEANRFQDTTNYAVRHVPWLAYTNVPASLTQDFSSFPTTAAGFASLPTVSFVIPALNHDMHDYNDSGGEVFDQTTSLEAIDKGDAWLHDNLDAYINWAKTNNSLFILVTDEDSSADWPLPATGEQNGEGYTASNLGPNSNNPGNSGPNQITTLFAGANIVPGQYAEGANAEGGGITNVNVLRTIESFYGLSPNGAQSPLALSAGANDLPITDIFAVPEPSIIALIGLAGAGMLFALRRRARRQAAQ